MREIGFPSELHNFNLFVVLKEDSFEQGFWNAFTVYLAWEQYLSASQPASAKRQFWHLLHPSQGIFCIPWVSVSTVGPWSWAFHTRSKSDLKHWGSRSQGDGCSLGLMGNHQWAPTFGLGASFHRAESCGKQNSAGANTEKMWERQKFNWFWHYWTRQTYRKRQLSQILCAFLINCVLFWRWDCEEIHSFEANREGLILTHTEELWSASKWMWSHVW